MSATMNTPTTAAAGLDETTFNRRVVGEPTLPRMPKVGLPESLYLKVAHQASEQHDDLTYEAAKVGQYLSLAVRDPDRPWGEKLKLFRHALKRHCVPPDHADELTRGWYKRLAEHSRKHAGLEALRLSREVDERYRMRLDIGQTADEIAEDAEVFFDAVCPYCETCPPIYRVEEWEQIKEIRDRWV